MKKLILVLAFLSVICSGCARVDTVLTIYKDKSAAISTELKYDQDLKNSKDANALRILHNYKNFLDDEYESAEEDTLKAEKYTDNLEKKDLDLSSLGFVSNIPSGKFIEVKRNFFVTSYNVDMTYDYKKSLERIEQPVPEVKKTEGGLKPEYLQEYADRSSIITPDNQNAGAADFAANYENNLNIEPAIKQPSLPPDDDFEADFSIKLPSAASYNNADRVNGQTYTWGIRKDSSTVIKLQYVVYSGFAIFFMILIGIAGLILMSRTILRHEAQKRVDKKE